MKPTTAFVYFVHSSLLTVAISVASAMPSWAGSIFLTGHDSDFHAFLGGNFNGAQNINKTAINYVMDSEFNTFVSNGVNKFLFVESKITPPVGHTNGVKGIIASGYTPGINFDHHDFTTLNSALDQLGTTYSAIVVASDFGGILRQAELDILNTRSSDIISFLNAGGGLYAMAEGNSGVGLTPKGGHYGFLPFVASSLAQGGHEENYSVTPFGASLGLKNSDINGNYSHTIFTSTSGLSVVDVDGKGHILSLAGRGNIDPEKGLAHVPEPSSTLGLLAFSTFGISSLLKRKRQQKVLNSVGS
ncbi:MAG: PEP-CTERM sorting domain-containing protein [Phormidium sp.]